MWLLEWTLIQSNWCPYEKRKFKHRHIQREDHVKTQAGSYDPILLELPSHGNFCTSVSLLTLSPLSAIVSLFLFLSS